MYERLIKVLAVELLLVLSIKTQNVSLGLPSFELHCESGCGGADLEAYLSRSSIVYGLISVAEESLTSADCYAQLRQLQAAIQHRQPWAIKVLDAAGTKAGSFVLGQNYWLGSRQICDALREPIPIRLMSGLQRNTRLDIITEMAPFDMYYSVLYLRHTSPWQLEVKLGREQYVHVGLCMPNACATHDIEALAVAYVEQGHFAAQEIYDMHAEVVQVKDLQLKDRFYAKLTLKILLAIVCFTVVMMVCAACLRKQTTSEKEARRSVRVSSNEAGASDFKTKLVTLIQCYDVGANCVQLFALKDMPPSESAVMDGLRSLISMAIALLHVSLFAFEINNTIPLYLICERFVVLSVFVDIFFALSGFLRVYYFFKSLQKNSGGRTQTTSQHHRRLEFLKTMGKRYFRFAPLYLVIICMADLWNAYSADVSVYHVDETLNHNCAQYWWRNVLFIQTFFPITEMCVTWSWTLSAEMYYFLLAAVLLSIYKRHPKFVKAFTICLLLLSVAWHTCVGLWLQMQISMESLWRTGYHLYFNPLARISPFIVGAIGGWYLSENSGSISRERVQTSIFYAFNLGMFCLLVQIMYSGERSSIFSLSLLLLARFCISLVTIGLIIAGALHCETWYCRLFGAKIFQHFNHLCYASYLIHPLIINFCVSLTSQPINAEFTQLVISSFGYLVLVYMGSIICSLAFDMPYINMSKRLFLP